MTDPSPPKAVLPLLKLTEGYFRSKGLASPRVDAEVLLAHVLGCKRFELYMMHDRPLTEPERDAYREFVRKRGTNVPLQYLTGEQAFRDLTVQVSDKVLIPRPETEELVEQVFRIVAPERSLLALRVLELGVGSGAISVALAASWPNARVWATDLSLDALDVARGNVAFHHLADRITLLHGDLFDPLDAHGEPFDLVISNPPYVATGDLGALHPEVRDHEPRLALDGGEDGLALIRAILNQAPKFLKPAAWCFLEIGYDQGPLILDMLRVNPHWTEGALSPDMTGRDRIVRARRVAG